MGKEKKEGENKGEEKTEQRNGGRKAAPSGGCRLQARKDVALRHAGVDGSWEPAGGGTGASPDSPSPNRPQSVPEAMQNAAERS